MLFRTDIVRTYMCIPGATFLNPPFPLSLPPPRTMLLVWLVLKVFAERLYDILSHERGAGAQQPGFYPSAFGADGRGASGFPPHLQQQHHHQQHHHQLRNDPPSSFGSSTASPSPDGSPAHLPQQPPVRNDSFESTASAHRASGGGGSEAGDGGEMGMSEQDRQVLLARCRSGPSSAAASAAAAEQDRQVLLARSRSGPADFNRDDDDHHHHYYRSNSSHHHHHHQYRQHPDGGVVFDHRPSRGEEGGRGGGGGGEYSFEGTRYGSHSSGPSGVLPTLPSLNYEQFSGGGVDRMRRAPWHGAADSTYVK